MIRHLTGKDKTLIKFENISDFKRYLDKNSDSENTRTLTRCDDWTGTETWAEFERYLADGNADITTEVKRETKYYINHFEQQLADRTEYMFDVTGEFFDIGAVMVGEPEAWIKEIVVKDEKFIELNVQGTYPHNTDLAKVRKNGAKVFAIAAILEQHGYLVKINMIFNQYHVIDDKPKSELRVELVAKDYDQPLDYKKFGILLGVPFFRRGVFRVLEIEYGHNLYDGYGKQLSTDGEIKLNDTDDVDNLEKMLSVKE